MANAVRALLRPRVLVGATASSVLADDQEVEDRPAVVLFAASWGGRLRTGPGGALLSVMTVTYNPRAAGDRSKLSVRVYRPSESTSAGRRKSPSDLRASQDPARRRLLTVISMRNSDCGSLMRPSGSRVRR